MKILAIRGKNLASLAGEFEIDFTKEPLSSAGIYAITGNTGAGKSTLLDALCIALYATSPRINKLSNSTGITDAGKFIIKEHDCRNILRKGTSEGYAEVDFKALDNKLYRARWSVKRARNAINGKLQDAECTLHAITDNHRIDGGKTETLAKIAELIGLTYEQFTRAVLLAQGEFATFLKAAPKEKAEILEKLTGSEIYSKISAKIYERWREAESETKLLEQKIKEIITLTDEERASLEKEQRTIALDLQTTEKEKSILEKKIAWIERKDALTNNLREAEKELDKAKEKHLATTPLAQSLTLIDSVQEIRDTYTTALETKRHINESNTLLHNEESKVAALDKEFAETQKKVTQALKEQETINNGWIKLQPKITEALAIEADCRNIEKQIAELEEKNQKNQKELKDAESEATILKKNIETEETKAEETEKWFTLHAPYATIVPKSEIVITNIEDIEASRTQIKNREKLLAEAATLLINEENRIKEKEKEAEILNNMLPAEIISLRNRLTEGEPCPVCGSRHHHITNTTNNHLKEEELAKARENIAQNIALAQKNIEESKNSINSHKAYIENIKNNIKNCEERNKEILRPIEHLVETHDTTFAGKLREIAALWNKKNTQKTITNESLAVNKTKLTTLQQRIEERKKEAAEYEGKIENLKKQEREKRGKINNLIGENNKAEEINEAYNKKIIAANTAVTTSIEARGNIMATREKLLGSIAQTKKTLKKLEETLQKTKTEIENFLQGREDTLTLQALHALLIIENNEIMRRRSIVESARNALITAQATHKERLKAIDEHEKEKEKPEEGEAPTLIKEKINYAEERKKNLLDRMSEISVKLKTDEENKLTHKRHLEEYTRKNDTLNKWVILNNTYGSAIGDKFKIIAQGYTLDILLEYANKHLHDISPRYSLARTAHDSLGIKVVDADILNEERSVHSLSGGETFLVSLALALSLSSLSSSKMSIESLFIDEGFGALDNDTLRTAMEALERLQGQGRKVGIISHLQDIIESVSTKIKVIKEQEGKSKVRIECS